METFNCPVCEYDFDINWKKFVTSFINNPNIFKPSIRWTPVCGVMILRCPNCTNRVWRHIDEDGVFRLIDKGLWPKK